jgi:hypothetical protein
MEFLQRVSPRAVKLDQLRIQWYRSTESKLTGTSGGRVVVVVEGTVVEAGTFVPMAEEASGRFESSKGTLEVGLGTVVVLGAAESSAPPVQLDAATRKHANTANFNLGLLGVPINKTSSSCGSYRHLSLAL